MQKPPRDLNTEDGVTPLNLLRHPFCFAGLLLLAVVFCFLNPLFPLYGTIPGKDSSIFIYIGKSFSQNIYFYKDIFDHKGVLLYLFNALGWAIGGKTGIWLINTLAVFVASVFSFQSAFLITKDKRLSFFVVVAVLVAAIRFYSRGNLTEDYAWPFITISLYLFLRYLLSGRLKYSDIFISGICFGCVLFLRPNMIGIWAACGIFLLIEMIFRKQYVKLFFVFLSFVLGGLFCTAPILLYLYKTNNLQSMYDCYILFNTQYSGNLALSNKLMGSYRLTEAFYAGSGTAAFLVAFYIYSLYKIRSFVVEKQRLIAFSFLFLALSFLSTLTSGYCYEHYLLVTIPCLIIPIALTVVWMSGVAQQIGIKRKTVLFIFSIPLLFPILNTGIFLKEIAIHATKHRNLPPEMIDTIKNNSSQEDKIIVYSKFYGTGNIYLESNRASASRFFYAFPILNINPDFYKAYITELKENSPKLVVMGTDPPPEELKELLKEKYEKIYSRGSLEKSTKYTIYKLKEQ